MVPGRHGHHGPHAVPNVFNIDEEPVQILRLGNQKEGTALVETCKVETAQMDFVKVKLILIVRALNINTYIISDSFMYQSNKQYLYFCRN